MRPAHLAVAAALAVLASACGGGSSPTTASTPGVRTPPDLAGFLSQPVATPSSCPSSDPGASVGRSSPWVNHVDVSLFLKPSAAADAVSALGRSLRQMQIVAKVYFESQAEAYAEFQRLYTCWARVPISQTPASYRIVLIPTATIAARNDLVAKALRSPAVDTASCDPALPCVDVVRSASADHQH